MPLQPSQETFIVQQRDKIYLSCLDLRIVEGGLVRADGAQEGNTPQAQQYTHFFCIRSNTVNRLSRAFTLWRPSTATVFLLQGWVCIARFPFSSNYGVDMSANVNACSIYFIPWKVKRKKKKVKREMLHLEHHQMKSLHQNHLGCPSPGSGQR